VLHATVDDSHLSFIDDARLLPLDPGPLPVDVIAGEPATAERVLVSDEGLALGVWEVQPGSWRSTRGDREHEYIVILGGRGTVRAPGSAPVALGPGAIVAFPPSTSLTWEITETLRKFYVIVTAPAKENADAAA
jgi:uncharacterized cupin superfamily protein